MNKATKTLIILTPGFPANEADSTCLPFPQLFVRSLKQVHSSLDIVVLAFQYPFIKSIYNWNGVTVCSFNGRNKGNIRHLLLWKAVWQTLNTIVKEKNVTGILSFWLGECALIGKLAAQKHTIKSFTWLLGQDAKKNNRYFSFSRPGACSLIALSDFLADEFHRNYKIMPAHIIPPGINTTALPAKKVARDIDILGVGSLIPLKQYDMFIRVVARLALGRPGIKTMICGSGPEKKHLQQLIKDAGLLDNIALNGEVSHDAILALMQRTKVFLHPSSYEGFATVLSEALYAGAQAVAFCKPMHQVFKHQHVVTTEDEMVATVNALLADRTGDDDQVITWPIETTCRKISALYGI